MANRFTGSEWTKIQGLFENSAEGFGLPPRRSKSVVIGTFNIRKLGAIKSRSSQSWQMLTDIISRFDLIAIQEIMDDLSGLEHILEKLGSNYGMVVSDVTGVKPGSRGNPERLGYLFNWKKIKRTAMASDITFDRSEITRNLYENRSDFSKAWEEHLIKMGRWEEKVIQKKAENKSPPSKPPIELPQFLTFIRQPHYVSFQVLGSGNAAPYEFLVVNAHLLYGEKKSEREWEFKALIEWLTIRAKKTDRLYHPNLLLLGDCNLDFDSNINVMRNNVDEFIKGLNDTVLKSKKAASTNFPLLTPHPTAGIIRTALRQKQTYDQIGLFSSDARLPSPEDNADAGATTNSFNYGVFNIANLIAQALHNKNITDITSKQRSNIYSKAGFDISDHMPVWMRLPKPGPIT